MPEITGNINFQNDNRITVGIGGDSTGDSAELRYRALANSMSDTSTQMPTISDYGQDDIEMRVDGYEHPDHIDDVMRVLSQMPRTVDSVRASDNGRSLRIAIGDTRTTFHRSTARRFLEMGYVVIAARDDHFFVAPVELVSGMRIADQETLDVELQLPTFQ